MIPGGNHLSTIGYGQTAVGFYNNTGTISQYNSTYCPPLNVEGYPDERLFMIGNGCATGNSNAFVVSYNGHSIVADINGTSSYAKSGRQPFAGGSYVDNTLAAWAIVTQPTKGYPGYHLNLLAAAANGSFNDFGIDSIEWWGNGTYVVFMADRKDPADNPIKAPYLPAAHPLATGAVVVTPLPSKVCVIANSTPVTNGVFTVSLTSPANIENPCASTEDSFMLMVVGR